MGVNNHGFNIAVATKYGIEEAILIENFMFWIKDKIIKEDFKDDGKAYVFYTSRELNLMFPYMSQSTLARKLKALEQIGVLSSRQDLNKFVYDRTKSYTIASQEVFNYYFPGENSTEELQSYINKHFSFQEMEFANSKTEEKTEVLNSVDTNSKNEISGLPKYKHVNFQNEKSDFPKSDALISQNEKTIPNINYINTNITTTTKKTSSSSLEKILEKEKFKRISEKTKQNICDKLPETTEEQLEFAYISILALDAEGKIKNFNGALFDSLKKSWELPNEDQKTENKIGFKQANSDLESIAIMRVFEFNNGIKTVPEAFDEFQAKIEKYRVSHSELVQEWTDFFWEKAKERDQFKRGVNEN